MWYSCEICFKISEISNLVTFPKLSHLLRYCSGNPEFSGHQKNRENYHGEFPRFLYDQGSFSEFMKQFWMSLLNFWEISKKYILEFWPPYFPLCHMGIGMGIKSESLWALQLFWNFLDTHNNWCGMEFMISLLINIGFLIFYVRPDVYLKLNSRILT
jgi:hypothetical protein